jgi:YbbR domain-containing protein
MKMKSRLKKHSLKFLSLFFSIFLWAYVLNSEKISFEKTVSLDYILPEDMIFAQKPPTEVTFHIVGPKAFVRTVLEREDKLVLDLNKANLKRQLSFHADINFNQLNLPFGMKVEKIVPRRVPIRLEKKASRIVPIKAQFSGELPDKISISKMEIIPSEVEVNGPRSLISGIKFLLTRPIDLGSLAGQDSLHIDIALPDERLSLQSSSEVFFKFRLKAADSNLILKDLPINFLSQYKNIDSKVRTATLKLLVPEKVSKNRSNVSSSIKIWADIPDKALGQIEVPLKVVLPPSIHLLEVIPKSIIVNIK